MGTAEEAAYILNDCKPEILFTSASQREKAEGAIKDLDYQINIIVFDEMENKGWDECFPYPVELNDMQDTAVILYTSGTTGSPKGVMLTYDNIMANIDSVTKHLEIYKPHDRVMIFLPLHHVFPLFGTMAATFCVGATAYMALSMKPDELKRVLHDYKISIMIAVPRLYELIRKGIRDKIDSSFVARTIFKIASKIKSRKLSRMLFKKVHDAMGGNLKYLVCGGAALDSEVAKDYETLGLEVLVGFGMTEAAPMMAFTRPDHVKIGSSGFEMYPDTVRIVDGEIVARGRNIMKGYYNRPEETAEVLKDGWLHTGDLGYFDRDGYLFVTGRKKEIMVLPSGKNINPEELEFKLTAMTTYIKEVAVYLHDGSIRCLIYPELERMKRDGIANMEEYFRWEVIDKLNRSVSPYKKIMQFSLIREELPKTRLGKTKRFELAEFAASVSSKKKSTVKEPDFEEYALLKKFLVDQSESEVHPEDHIEIDLGLDSLDKVSLQLFLKQTFGVELDEEILMHHSSVTALAEYVRDNKQRMELLEINWKEILSKKSDLELPRSMFTHTIIKNLGKLWLKCYFRFKGTGFENIPKGPFIIAPNHQSFFDGLFVASYVKDSILKKTYFFAKAKHVKSKWRQYLAARNNVIVMDINKDVKESLLKMADVLRQGKNIIIFPEGTRTRDGKVGHFKKTFAILSRELNVPVVPVAISGAFKALPKGSLFPKPFSKIRVKYLPPIFPEDKSYEEIVETVRERIEKNCNGV